jgi:hypothetical protein
MKAFDMGASQEVVFCFERFKNHSFANERFGNQSKTSGRGTQNRMAITHRARGGLVVGCSCDRVKPRKAYKYRGSCIVQSGG